jgi:hypothetical protein
MPYPNIYIDLPQPSDYHSLSSARASVCRICLLCWRVFCTIMACTFSHPDNARLSSVSNDSIGNGLSDCIRVIFSDLPSVAIVQCGISASSILFKSKVSPDVGGNTEDGTIVYEAGGRSTYIVVHGYPRIDERQSHCIDCGL